MKRRIFLLIVVIASNVAVAFGRNKALFNAYISKFKVLSTDTIDNRSFRNCARIDNKFVRLFISNEGDCECEDEDEELWYKYAFKIEKKDFIFAFVNKVCDKPSSSGTYPYSDMILLVYSRKGKLIDHKIVARRGERWDRSYSGNTNAFRLRVEQANISMEDIKKLYTFPYPCTIITREFTVTQEGRIIEKVVVEGKGTLVWDEDRRESRIVKAQK